MKQELDIIKGIHPGFYLDRKIHEQHLKKGQLALAINEYPQTLTTITKGKRDMNTALALKLEKALGLDEGMLMILQVYYDIEKIKKKQNTSTPDLHKLRPGIFWDTRMESIDWHRQYRAVIRRIFERGNEREKNEITRFYGKEKIQKVINKNK
jgi:antitoxin HigA-1